MENMVPAVVNDNQFKLTNFYGESEIATIVKVDKKTFVVTDGSDEVYFYKEPKENRETASDTSQDSTGQEEARTEEALCRTTSYTDGVEDGFYDEICTFNEKGYLIEVKYLDKEGNVYQFSQWEFDEHDNENKWVCYDVDDEKLEVTGRIEYTDYENIEDGFYRKSENYNGLEELELADECFYDKDYRLVRIKRYDQEGELLFEIEYIYDEEDRLAEDIWYYASGELERNVYFYEQSSEKPIYMMQYNESGELEGIYTWEYDEYGRKISEYWKDAEGRLTLKSDYDYGFNE